MTPLIAVPAVVALFLIAGIVLAARITTQYKRGVAVPAGRLAGLAAPAVINPSTEVPLVTTPSGRGGEAR